MQIQVELQDVMGSDRAIAEAAWTSSLTYNSKKLRSDEDVARIVERLANDRHSTPFESVIFRWWIKMPIAIDRQYVTHRLQSMSGLSGRYRRMPTEYLVMADDVMEISQKLPKVDQYKCIDGSIIYGERDGLLEYIKVCERANNSYSGLTSIAQNEYKLGNITEAEYKRFREFIRGMLPQHNMTERVAIINLRSWSNFIKLRSSPHAQPEIRQVAELMLKKAKESNVCPVALAALEKNNWII
jgi:thymidylate synthase (FAD)